MIRHVNKFTQFLNVPKKRLNPSSYCSCQLLIVSSAARRHFIASPQSFGTIATANSDKERDFMIFLGGLSGQRRNGSTSSNKVIKQFMTDPSLIEYYFKEKNLPSKVKVEDVIDTAVVLVAYKAYIVTMLKYFDDYFKDGAATFQQIENLGGALDTNKWQEFNHKIDVNQKLIKAIAAKQFEQFGKDGKLTKEEWTQWLLSDDLFKFVMKGK